MLLNKKHVKGFIKGYCQAKRPRFTRVSDSYMVELDAKLRQIIISQIHALPSVGKTVK